MQPDQKNIPSKGVRVNENIKVKEVRVISEDGKQLGILPTREAIRIAKEQGLDLIEVQPNVTPPVCKILDYGKYKYQQKQKAKEAKKNQVTIEIKEMKFRPTIEKHDFDTKVSHIRDFISSGNKCLITVMFRGREMAHTDLGQVLLNRISEDLKDIAILEGSSRLEGRDMFMMLAPKRNQKDN